MKSIYALTLSALLALPLAAQAQTRGGQRANASGYGSMSYTYGDARIVVVEPDGGGSLDGVKLGGSLQFDPQLFGVASLTSLGDRGVDLTYLDFGLGFRSALQSDVDLVLIGGLVFAQIDTPGGDDDDTGLSLTGGVRGIATPQIEYGAYANYTSVFDDGDLTLTGEGLLHLNRNLALAASLGLSDDATTLTFGARWSFR
jgi:hypothetical protein